MSLLQAIILGIIQGLTEYLPVSSSAHLVFVPYLLGWQLDPEVSFVFNVLVQLGTLLAVIVYFWRDLREVLSAWVVGIRSRAPLATPRSRLGWYLILATIPAGIAGLLLKDAVEAAFQSHIFTALFLLVTAALLLTSERFAAQKRNLEDMTARDALVMGLMQALAIFPGISRSGSTIAGGMFSGMERRPAARFSFLMSIPIMVAAGAAAAADLFAFPNFSAVLPLVAAGFIVAAVVGYLSIHWLLGYLQRNSLSSFAWYCFIAAAIVLVTALLRG